MSSGNAAADRPTELAHCIDGSTEGRSLDFGDECERVAIYGVINFGAIVNTIPAAPSPNSGSRGGGSSGWDFASRSP